MMRWQITYPIIRLPVDGNDLPPYGVTTLRDRTIQLSGKPYRSRCPQVASANGVPPNGSGSLSASPPHTAEGYSHTGHCMMTSDAQGRYRPTRHMSGDASGTGTDGPIQYRRLRYLYYIVHKDNIASVLASGALLCRSRALAAGIPYDISNLEVNQRRSGKIDSIQRRPLHDYVNLYFRARNPMLYARRQLQSDLVVLCVDRRLLKEPGVVFTDGNAASSATRFFYNLGDLKELDWDCLEADYWNDFDDGKRTRCAEVLVPGSVPLSRVERAVVSNEPLRDELTSLRWPTRVDVRPEGFF